MAETISGSITTGVVLAGTMVISSAQDGTVVVGNQVEGQIVGGPQGPAGATGPQGTAGQGVPTGGATGQVLAKTTGADYDTEWIDQTGSVDSVNGQTGTVVLDIDDVAPTQTGNAGKVLKTDGTNATWQTAGGVSDWGDIGGTLSDQTDLQNALNNKADKVSGATSGHLAGLDTNGNLTDSGLDGPTVSSQISDLYASKADDNAVVKLTGNQTIAGVKTFSDNIVASGTVDGRDIASDGSKLDGIEANADVTDATNVDAAGAVMNSDTSTASMSFVVDEDNMASDSATKVPTQQSVKAYADTKQPLDSDLTTIAGLTATTDNFIQSKSGAWASRTPAQVAADLTHNNLGGLTTGDPHTQYALLAGRSGGQTLIGGTASGNNLLLRSTSDSTKGYISLGDTASTKVIVGGTSMPLATSAVFGVNNNRTFSSAGDNYGNDFRSLPTFSGTTGGNFTGADFTTLPTASVNMNTITAVFFQAAGSSTGTVTSAIGMGSFASSVGAPTTTAISARAQTGGFAGAVTNSFGVLVDSGQFFGSSTNVVGVSVGGLPGSTSKIGIDVAAQTGASTTNIGIRNASTTVNTPATAQNITAAATALTITSSVKQITANNNYTLSAAPTIADGQDGQVITIINVDTTDTITLQDQGTLGSSNLRLSASTIALGPRDSITLLYSSTVGDWVQIGQTNVI